MGFGPTYVAHIPPLEGWYSRDSLCYGVGARVVYITAKNAKKKNPTEKQGTEPKKTHLPGGFSERSEDLSLCPPQALKFLNSTLYVEISLGLPTREKP